MSTLQCATDENGVPHFWCNTQEGFGTRGLHKCIWILENKHCAGGVCCGEYKQRFSSHVAKQRQFSFFLPPSAVNLWMFIISICFLKTSSWAIIVTKSNHCCETTLTISALCAKGADKNHGIAAVFWPNFMKVSDDKWLYTTGKTRPLVGLYLSWFISNSSCQRIPYQQ